MQLLKRRAGGTGADERADEADSAVADAAPAERTTPDPPTTPGTPATTTTSGEHPVRSRWRRTVTVPVTVPRRSIRQTVTVPSRSVERTTTPGLRVGPILAVAAGAVLAVVGAVALLRAGVDESWFTPQVQVLDADHTALLGVAEIGAGQPHDAPALGMRKAGKHRPSVGRHAHGGRLMAGGGELKLAMEDVGHLQARIARPVERGFGAAMADRLLLQIFEDAAEGDMILMIAADARQVLDHRDVVAAQLVGRPDAGLQQHFRRVDGTK